MTRLIDPPGAQDPKDLTLLPQNDEDLPPTTGTHVEKPYLENIPENTSHTDQTDQTGTRNIAANNTHTLLPQIDSILQQPKFTLLIPGRKICLRRCNDSHGNKTHRDQQTKSQKSQQHACCSTTVTTKSLWISKSSSHIDTYDSTRSI